MKGSAWLPAAALCLGALVPAAAPDEACAAGAPRAALVVDAGAAGVQTLCVTLPHEGVSGIQLIELAGRQHGLVYRLGFGGQAVCMLGGVGPTQGDCFGDFPDFWGYWRGDGSAGWSWSATGAGAVAVGDGDVEGWSWGSGSDGSSHPPPPATAFADVCAPERPRPAQEPAEPPAPEPAEPPAPEPDDPPAPSGGDGSGTAPAPPEASPRAGPPAGGRGSKGGAPASARATRSTRPRPDGARAPARGERGPPRTRSPAAPESGDDPAALPARAAVPADAGAGPPGAAIAGLGATLVLVGAGAVLVRRRRPGA